MLCHFESSLVLPVRCISNKSWNKNLGSTDSLSQATVRRMMQLGFSMYEVTRFSIISLSSPVAIMPTTHEYCIIGVELRRRTGQIAEREISDIWSAYLQRYTVPRECHLRCHSRFSSQKHVRRSTRAKDGALRASDAVLDFQFIVDDAAKLDDGRLAPRLAIWLIRELKCDGALPGALRRREPAFCGSPKSRRESELLWAAGRAQS